MSSARFIVSLESAGSELAREVVKAPTSSTHEDPDEAINLAIHEAIDRWTLSVGDVIRIVDGGA